MEYSALRGAHMGFAYLSILLFVIRFFLFSAKPVLRTNKLLKILPHIIDSLLLIFALLLLHNVWGSPVVDWWIAAKVVGLLGYIGFGIGAIKRGSWPAFIGALICFAYIFGAAKAHSVLSWLAVL
ncbi:SirB2 family protein [Bacterioplanoides sp.]|uniref:SirB2 family protein n=1 Tax=Bacterioplanoides sp. TaxID=2066072 RepID=UPI003B002DCB